MPTHQLLSNVSERGAAADATMVGTALGQRPDETDPGDPNFLQRMFSHMVDTVGNQARVIGEALGSGSPVERAIRDRAGAFLGGEMGFQQELPAQEQVREVSAFVTGPASVGFVVPGLPGGPHFRTVKDLSEAAKKVPTMDLVKIWQDAWRGLKAPRGPKPQPGTSRLPETWGAEGFGEVAGTHRLHGEAVANVFEREIATRALLGGDQQARNWLSLAGSPGSGLSGDARQEAMEIIMSATVDLDRSDALFQLLDQVLGIY